jgi:diaminopimelate decarboxylase
MILPETSEVNDKGHLLVAGNDVTELAEKYGTPLYIIDIATIKNQCRRYRDNFNFPDINAGIIYAAKAFACTAMFQLIKEQGFGLDVSTGGELYIALNSGFPAESIYFHGNNKSMEEIRYGLESGVGYFMVDNFEELGNLGKLCWENNIRQKIMLRTSPGIKADTHEYIQTGKPDSKFGFSIQDGTAMEAVKMAGQYNQLEIAGIHAHIGSQIFNISCYEKLIEVMVKFLRDIMDETGISVTGIDIGGGLGIQYTEDDKPSGIKDLSGLVHNAVVRYQKKFNIKLDKIYLEPGRSIVGNAGITLYRIGSIKEMGGSKRYVLVDGGMSDNIRPMLYHARYSAHIANRMQYKKNSDKKNEVKKMRYSVVGKHCESGDVIIEDIELPVASRGDFIFVASTGAYCYAMSSNYNGQPRNAVVAVEDGKSWLWKKRQTYKDLVIGDVRLYEK